MEIAKTRFGTIEFDEARILTISGGLIGFPKEVKFVFLEPPAGQAVAWLQSVESPELAFPVVAATIFGPDYPTPTLAELARRAKLTRGDEEVTALVVVASQKPMGWIANMLAPIVINITTRTGAQVVLDPVKYSAVAAFAIPRLSAPVDAGRGGAADSTA